jgi:hypothetical protein
VSRVRGPAGVFVVLAVLLIETGSAAARASVPGEKAALTAVRRAVASGRLDRAAAAADRAEIARAVHLVHVLPSGRREHVQVALEQVGALAGRLTKPRALALFGQLRANDDYFARHWPPKSKRDITDSDGIVYRYFPGRCFEFHPLANFSALNGRVAAKDAAGAQLLADALISRGIGRRGGGIGWEYYFRFEGGRPPWVSGMAQAVAAQAFARTASLVTGESDLLLHEAGAGYRAIPGRLLTKVTAGPWIRLYSFKSTPVLNAQLQSVLSLDSYAKATGDQAAAALAGRMQEAAAATLPRFDTGYWTYYSLAGDPSPLSYHEYVDRLLRKLSSADPRFAEAAARFATYLRQPPAFKLATAPVGAIRFWLSKPAWVTVVARAGGAARLSLGAGWHTLRWREPKRAGIYGIKVTAVGWAGNRASFAALPIVRVRAVHHQPPQTRRAPAGAGSTAANSVAAFTTGAGVADASQVAQAASLGLGLVRMAIPWQPGEAAPEPSVVASLQSLPSQVGLVLELGATELPADDAGRAELADYAASLAGQAPTLHYLTLTPAPSPATAAAYADAVAAIRTAVQAVRSDVGVGPTVDGSATQPQRTTIALSNELAREGVRPDVVAFRPAPIAGSGVWAAGDVGQLDAALSKTLGTAPPVLLDAVATPTTVPPSELSGYAGGAPPTDGAVSPATQASTYAAVLGAASCSPNVSGLLFDRLVDDGAQPEPATGLYYASGDPKPSAAAVGRTIREIDRGAVVCPGAAARVTPTTLTFPEQLGRTSRASITLACSRDCLYLVTLVGAGGRPLVAQRGALKGGYPPQTIALPRRTLSSGRYRVDVRLVSRVDPGAVTRKRSALLVVP